MGSVFKSARTIVQEMCDKYKEITGITLTPDMTDNTWVIKFWADAGAISSLYAENQRTLNDFFVPSASEQALIKHLAARSLQPRILAQKSRGIVRLTTTGAANITTATIIKRSSDGELFQCIQSGTRASAGTIDLYFESLNTGSHLNLDTTGEPFTLETPITNVESDCESVTKFLDGRDLESLDEMRVRCLTHDRDDNTGGNPAAYEAWARESNPEVVTAKAIKIPRGPDTVDVIITSGTTDIQEAVENGTVITRVPSQALIDEVEVYIADRNPTTDDVRVKAPVEETLDVTFNYSLYNETLANRSFVDSEIRKVIEIFIYEAKPQDVLRPTDLERAVDTRIGDLVKERHCDNFDGATSFYIVPDDKIEIPGTITIGSF